MIKQDLIDYKTWKKRMCKLNEDIDRLSEKDIDVVSGKVKGSMDSYPYIERRFTVQMEVPEQAEKVNEQIARKEREIEELERKMREVEDFIDDIEDVQVKTIFEYRYLEGMSCAEIGKKFGYTHARISQLISRSLKDLQNLQHLQKEV